MGTQSTWGRLLFWLVELDVDKMAARRVTATTVDWAKFAEKIPAAQKPAFNALKNKTDAHIRKLASLPESLPKIDFADYKAKIAVAGMVDDFQKKYDALKIPYPQDSYTSAIDSEASSLKAAYTKFVEQSQTRIVGIKAEQAKWENMMPIEEMNLEEAIEAGLGRGLGDPIVPNAPLDVAKFDADCEELAKKFPEMRKELEAKGDGH